MVRKIFSCIDLLNSLILLSNLLQGKSLKTQRVANLESASMKNRRRRNVDDEEGESLDDLLKSVEKKGNEEDAEDDITMDEEEERRRELLERSRAGSDVKLPTGRKLSIQKVRQATSDLNLFCNFDKFLSKTSDI